MKVILIDDQPMFTELLKMAIMQMPGIAEVQIFNSGDDFVYVKHVPSPELVILDIRMPGMDGIKVIEYCRNEYGNGLKIVVLSFMSNIQIVKQAIKAGANGYITKSADIEELQAGIGEVLQGRQYISSVVRNEMIKTMFITEDINFHLTEREKQVLEYVCKGFTYKEIAYELHITYHTVHYYYKNLLKKLKIKKSRDLIVFAMLNGLYMPDTEM